MPTPEQEARTIVAAGHIDGNLADDTWLEMPAKTMIAAVAKVIRSERELCAKVALEIGYPQWDDDINEQHRNAWEQCANRIANKLRGIG